MSSSDDFFSSEIGSPPKQSASLTSRSGASRRAPPPPPPKSAGGGTAATKRPSSTRPRPTTTTTTTASSASQRRSARPLASSSSSSGVRSRTAPSQNRPVGSYYQSGTSAAAPAPAAAATESWDWSPAPAPAPANDFSSWAAPAPSTGGDTNNAGGSDWYSTSSSAPGTNATAAGGMYTSSGFANPGASQQQQQQQPQSSAGFYGSAAQPTPAAGAPVGNPSFLSGSMDQQAAPAPSIMNPAVFTPSPADTSTNENTGTFDGEEAPLLEELGVNIQHITTKSRAVVLPFSRRWGVTIMDPSQIVQDSDLAGPIAFALILGAEMVLAGKLQFGYIYGFGVFGCLSMTLVVNLMSPSTEGISFWTVSSVLGYALIPVNLLAAIKLIVINLASLQTLGRILGLLTVAWSTIASTRLLELGCGLREQRYLIAYPIVLLYSAFVMITIF